MGVTGTTITLRLFVKDLATVIAAYDTIQVFRSTGDIQGPWSPVAESLSTSSMTATQKGEPYALNGKTLELKLDNLTELSIPFAGADPYWGAAAIVDINAVLGILGTADMVDGYLRITTVSDGAAASIQINGGDAYANLGFQEDSYGLGVDAGIPLVIGVPDYTYDDPNGSEDYWYRFRYYNSVSGAHSPYCAPFPALPIYKLPSSSLITGTARLVDISGRALPNQRVIVWNLYEPSITGLYGVFGTQVTAITDNDGFCELSLIRGSLVQVVFEGTSVRRRIRVPTTGSEFDLLDESLADDEFGIQYPTLRIAERRTI